jgi:hypothetical protein
LVPFSPVIPLYVAIASICCAVQVPADRHAAYWSAVADGAGAEFSPDAGVVGAVVAGAVAPAGGAEELPPQPAVSSPAAHTAITAIPPVDEIPYMGVGRAIVTCVT